MFYKYIYSAPGQLPQMERINTQYFACLCQWLHICNLLPFVFDKYIATNLVCRSHDFWQYYSTLYMHMHWCSHTWAEHQNSRRHQRDINSLSLPKELPQISSNPSEPPTWTWKWHQEHVMQNTYTKNKFAWYISTM